MTLPRFFLLVVAFLLICFQSKAIYPGKIDSISNELDRIYLSSPIPLFTPVHLEEMRKERTKLDIQADAREAALLDFCEAFLIVQNPAFRDSTEFNRADSLLTSSMEYFESHGMRYESGRANFLRANVLYKQYDYLGTLRYLETAADIFRAGGYDEYTGKTLIFFGNLWMDVGEYDKALEYYTQAEGYYLRSDNPQKATYPRLNLSTIYAIQGDIERSMAVQDSMLAEANQSGEYILGSLVKINKSINLMESGRPQEALTLLLEVESRLDSIPNVPHTMSVKMSLAKYYMEAGDNHTALRYTLESVALSDYSEQVYLSMISYEWLYLLYEKTGNRELAYETLKRLRELTAEFDMRSKQSDLNREMFLMEMSRSEERLLLEKHKVRLHRFYLLILLLISIIVISLTLFYLRNVAMKRKMKVLENEYLREQMLRIETMNKLEMVEKEKELDAKKRELLTANQLLSEKNRVLRSVLSLFEGKYNKGELPYNVYKDIESYIASMVEIDDQWSDFTTHFEQVHPEFYRTITILHPQLTENELRLAAYIKIGISNKQISRMLSITPRGVLTARYRLKKKLNLATDDSLENYIRDL